MKTSVVRNAEKKSMYAILSVVVLISGLFICPVHANNINLLVSPSNSVSPDFKDEEFTDLYNATPWIEKSAYEKAIPYLTHGREIAPTNLFVLYNLATSHYELGQIQNSEQNYHLKRAEEAFVRLQSLSPELLAPYLKLGKIAMMQDRLEEALAYYKMGLEAVPNNALLLFNLGGVYDRQSKVPEAIDYYQKAIQSDPDMIYAYNNLGLLYEQLKQYDKAEKSYLSAVTHDPAYNYARLNLGTLYLQKGNLLQAKEQFNRAILNEPQNSWAYLYLGNVYFRLQNYQKALETFQKSAQYNPSNAKTYYLMAVTFFKLQRNDEALQAGDKYITLDPTGPFADEMNHLIGLLKRQQQTALCNSVNNPGSVCK